MKISRHKFYDKYKKIFGKISKEKTVDVINSILSAYEQEEVTSAPVEKLAYMLATVRHEVGANMLPIVENLNYSSAKRIMQVWPSRFPTVESANPYVNNPQLLGNKVYGGRMGNGVLEGYKFRGRGIGCQLTGYDNYKKFGELLGVDLVGNPDLAMDIKVGTNILIKGMLNGMFTGKKLQKYINNTSVDYYNARDVVNPDKQRVGMSIALDAHNFEKIIKEALI